jgi:uncharacterized membrane protein
MNRTGVAVFAFVGVFVAGAISGGFVGTRMSQNWAHHHAAELFAQQQFKRLADHLSLTPEQRQRIRPIVTEAGQEVQAHRREISLVTEKMEEDVRQELTKEQRDKFDSVRARMHDSEKAFQRWIREQRALRQEGKGPVGPEAPATAP